LEGLDSATREDLEVIVATIDSLLPADAKSLSIILGGSFARNEGGHYESEGRRLPFGSYDLEVIVPRPILDSEREPIDTRLEEALTFRPAYSDTHATLHEDGGVRNVLDLRFKTQDEFYNRAPDLDTYDLAQRHRVLSGVDPIRDRLSIGIGDVSVFGPWRKLGNRLVATLKCINLDYRERAPTVQEALAFRLAVCETYLELTGLIGFLHGSYQTAYSSRLEFLETSSGLWRTWTPESDAFVVRVEAARKFILHPKPERIDSNKIFSEWFDLVYDVGRVLPHAINLILLTKRVPLARLSETLNRAGEQGKQAGVVSDPFRADWRPLVAQQVRLYPSLYFRDLISSFLRRKGRNLPMENFLCAQASRYYGAMENYLWMGRSWIFRNLRRATLAPAAFQSAVLPLLLFSFSPKGEVDTKALEMFDTLMNRYMLIPFDFLPPDKRWEATKRCFVHEMLDYRAQS
jgi:hypothetical protein